MKIISNANRVPTINFPIEGLTDENTFTWNEYLNRNPEIGLLKVQTTTANGLIPIMDARVIIEKNLGANSFVIGEFLTDVNGQTAMIALPAPERTLSLTPQAATPYSFYTMTITHPNYKDVTDLNTPIFSGITSVQPVGLIPKVPINADLSPDNQSNTARN